MKLKLNKRILLETIERFPNGKIKSQNTHLGKVHKIVNYKLDPETNESIKDSTKTNINKNDRTHEAYSYLNRSSIPNEVELEALSNNTNIKGLGSRLMRSDAKDFPNHKITLYNGSGAETTKFPKGRETSFYSKYKIKPQKGNEMFGTILPKNIRAVEDPVHKQRLETNRTKE